MPQIPKYIHEAKVNLDIHITNVEDGVDLLVYPPLGVVQKGQWRVVGKEGALELIIKTKISCTRLLSGILKAKAEGNHPLIGDSYIEVLNKGLEA